MAAQIIYLLFVFTNLLISANMHDKPKKGKHNFWHTFIAMCIVMPLLYWGGFFDVFTI